MQRTHSDRHHPMTRGLAAWLLGALVCAPPYLPAAQAGGVEGEQVVKGRASVERNGDLTVIRPSDGAIIHYSRFDIATQETVRFEQPDAQSRVLNRVFGKASQIDGRLEANGIVYLVNPSGIFFGRDAVVDVGRLVAASGYLSNRDFLKERDRFQLSGPIENLGEIQAHSITLLGKTVANHGTIVAPGGLIALVAGDRAMLVKREGGIAIEVEGGGGETPGILQTGTVDASGGSALFAVGDHYSLALNHTGVTRGRSIDAKAGDDGLVRVAGTLDASSATGRGGRVRVIGTRVWLEGANVDASGATGGGRIRIGGELRGAGPSNALRTLVDAHSVLRADALTAGDGGSIVVFSEEATGFLGHISARGGAQGGDGGFAELSSNGRLIDQGSVDLGAPAGDVGTLLYDPQDILILGGAGTSDGDISDGSILFGDEESGAPPFQIFEADLEATNANIVLEARNSIRAQGTFSDAALAIQSGNDLTLRTRNDVGDATGSLSPSPGIDLTTSDHGADLEVRTAGDGTILMETGTGAVQTRTGNVIDPLVEAPLRVGKLTTVGSQVSLTTRDGSISANTIVASGTDGTEGTNGGRITLSAGDLDGSNDTTILVTGDLTSRGGNGSAGRGGNGGIIEAATGGTPLPVPRPPLAELPDALGGGSITLANIDNHGGNGTGGAGGSAGGVVRVTAEVRGDVFVGDITSTGGDGNDPAAVSPGGFGGPVVITTDNGDVRVGDIDTTAGDTDGMQQPEPPDPPDPDAPVVPLERGGNGGGVTITAGRGSTTFGKNPDPHGDILLAGTVTTFGGDQGDSENENGDGFGGTVDLVAKDSIEHDGDAGPHIATDGSVELSGAEIGADGTLQIDGGGPLDQIGRINTLSVDSSGRADVAVAAAAFEGVFVTSRDTTTDIDVVQGGDEIRVDGGTVTRIDTTAEHTVAFVTMDDGKANEFDTELDMLIPTGSIDAGSAVELRGEDDVTLGNGAGAAIRAHIDPFSEDDDGNSFAADIVINANFDNSGPTFGTGRIISNGGRIDRNADGADNAGQLLLIAADGIGTQAIPIQTTGGGATGVTNGRTVLGDADDGGIFLHNLASGPAGDLTLTQVGPAFGARQLSGAGAIEIRNDNGDLVLENQVRTSGGPDPDGAGPGLSPGGAVTLAGTRIVLSTSGPAVDANGAVTLDGDVALTRNSTIRSRTDRDVRIEGGIDTDTDPALGDTVLSLVVQTEGTTRVAGDVGVQKNLSDLTLGGGLLVGTGDRSIRVARTLDVNGDVAVDGANDSGSLTILSGSQVMIEGNVGVGATPGNGRFSGLTIAQNTTLPVSVPVPTVSFDGELAQSVVTGAGGIAINSAGRPDVPDVATIGKSGGDLTLDTAGLLDIGQNEKLTVQGNATLTGGTGVRIGDVSALELRVSSPDTQVRRREAAPVLLSNGDRTADGGTDLIANLVSFTGSAPTEIGTGPAVRIAAGRIENAGSIATTGLNRIGTGRMERNGSLLDLAILGSDPGHEQPLRGPDIDGIVPPRTTGAQPLGTALPPGADATLAWLRCDAQPDDNDCPQAPPGSPLDTPRGQALAQSAEGWLGSSDDARARRAAVARLEPVALHELALFLTEVRLLGLSDPDYQIVRDALYAEILSDAGAAAPEPAVLAQGVQAQAPGIPL